ncbi:MAG: extracellular solute-binding protein, partial [Leifsonia sp.]
MSTNRTRGRLAAIAGICTAASLSLAACNSSDPGSSNDGGDIVIRIAAGSSGDAVDSQFDAIAQRYEDKYPGRTVEVIIQEDDIYQTTGLPTLLSSREAPDAYFEWSGPRMAGHVADGNGYDLDEALHGDLFTGRFDEGAFTNMSVDGSGIYMVPWTGDVTNVVWYDKSVFEELGLSVPTDWDSYLAVNQAILDSGETPLVFGNKDQWPVGSVASQIASRVAGEQLYSDTMDGLKPLNSPEMVESFEYLASLAPYVNESVNALADDEANLQFFLQKAATIQIGSWLMADAATDAEGLDFDYFNLPAIPSGRGDQSSVLGISTGFMVNAKSEHVQETIDLLAMMVDPEGTKAWAEAGLAPMTIDPFAGVDADPRTVSLAEMLSTASTLVAPADSGHDIEVAAAFYDAAAS